VNAFIARTELTTGMNAMAMAPLATEAESSSVSGIAVPGPAADHTRSHSVAALGGGDVSAAGDPDQGNQLDPKFTTPYVDRGILFFRDKKDEHAFPDLLPLKRSEKPGRTKSLLATAGRTRQDTPPRNVPLPQPRTVPRFMAPQPWYASAATTPFSESQR
jgi:hypothetical protein